MIEIMCILGIVVAFGAPAGIIGWAMLDHNKSHKD